MIKAKQERLPLISLLYLLLIAITGCGVASNIYGSWRVKKEEITIKDEFKFLEEIEPDLLENKFKRKFPGNLKIDGLLFFVKKKQVKINENRQYHYKVSDSFLYISNGDAVYKLSYNLLKNKLILGRELYQGKIEWTLERD